MIEEDWIDSYEKEFEIFDVKSIECIDINFIFLDGDNNIEHIKKNKVKLNNNNLSSNDIINILIKESLFKNVKYKVKHSFLYNFEANDVECSNHKDKFIRNVNYQKNVLFNKTIELFEKLSAIYFIMHSPPKSNCQTRRLLSNSNNKTKKKLRLTVTNRLKDKP